MRDPILVLPTLFFIILFFGQAALYAQAPLGMVTGHVRADENSLGIGSVQVSIRDLTGVGLMEVSTDALGNYRFLALAAGIYELSFQKSGYLTSIVRSVRVESGRTSSVHVALKRSQPGNQESVFLDWRDEPVNPWGSAYGSVFDSRQLTRLPSPRNIWALLENQEPSSVTNRVDEGGIMTGSIALLGVRGGSWTQNGYQFDRINVTDPFDTGKPLIYPDYGSLQELQVSTAFHLSPVPFPGASINISSRESNRRVHAEAEAYYLGEPFQSSNLDDRLRAFGFDTTPHFKRFGEGQFAVNGPVPLTKKWSYFTSVGIQWLSKVVPDFPEIPTAKVFSGLLRFDGSVTPRDQLAAVVTGQWIKNSNLGAGPGISPSATLHGNDRFEVVQGHWTHRQTPETVWQLRFGFSHASPTDTFQHGVSEPSRIQLFTGETTGAAPVEADSARSRFSLVGQGQSWRRLFGNNWNHLLDFGFDVEKSLATEARRIFKDVQLIYFPTDVPAQIIQYNTPSLPKYRLREYSLFLDDHFRFSDRILFRFGLTLNGSNGYLPDQRSAAGTYVPARELAGVSDVISWTSLEPRVGLAIPVLRRFGDGTRLSAYFARYHYLLTMRYLGYANPTSLGGQVFNWVDKNQDRSFQPGEEGGLLRVFGGPYSSIDPQLRRPFTDEWGFGVDHLFSHRLQASLRLFRRDDKWLAETVNVGVPISAFRPVGVYDLGNDNSQGTADDQILTVFDQDPRSLGHDHLLLTNPPPHSARYKGLEAIIRKEVFDHWFLATSFTAYKAVGSSSPGNSEFENDPGVVGSLFDNPNTLVNSRGRFFFDRAFVAKVAAYGRGPLGFHFGTVVKYFDGLPYGRRLIITGFNQGPFFVMATPRGESGGPRTQFNLTFDQRIDREFAIGRIKLSCLIDIFNLLNLNKNLREYDISGPLFPLRQPLEVENPRVVRFGIRWNF